jgi:hypothetical protein
LATLPAVETPRPPHHPSRVWWALAGTVLALGFLLLDVRASAQGILRPIRAGAKGPAAEVIARDFPEASLPDEVGLDGQQFYAIARDPFHPKSVAPSLDRPQYRYQRPLYPMLAWLLHPSGGGPGLVDAFVVVSLIGAFVGAVALGALSDLVLGPPWLALLYPLLPGALWALTSSVADGLAVSLSLVTLWAVLRSHNRLAWCAAIAAALTRETTILVPLALLASRRRREEWPLLVLPLLALAAWSGVVHAVVPGGGLPSEHLVFPLSGLLDAARSRWIHGRELVGMAATLSALVTGLFVVALRRGPSELRWAIGLQLAFLTLCSGAVVGNDFGGTRATLTLLSLSVLGLTSGTRAALPNAAGKLQGAAACRTTTLGAM